jgi:glutamate-1-semialdehyde 2,1-aminomutase
MRRVLAFLWRLEPFHRVRDRIWLSLAKHRSLAGHPFTALLVARLTRGFSYSQEEVWVADGASWQVGARRRDAVRRLGEFFRARSPRTLRASDVLRDGASDAALVDAYRVPFPFAAEVQAQLPVPTIVARTDGARLCDLDGHWSWDLGGSYGVNAFGVEFYKENLRAAAEEAQAVGLLLGPVHPVVLDNIARLREISGLEEVSFHMSGTEAVMQAVRLARYHTGRSHVVRFAGSYHGWWDGVQAGPGNPRPAAGVFTLAEVSQATLRVLRTRDDVAAVLVNPVQAMCPNASPPSDSTLVSNDRRFCFDRQAYASWLAELRQVCNERGIALILDEVFLGFRLARGGAQEYFGVRADLVTYGKTLGGGLPVGVVCGTRRWMRRFRPETPADLCFARGTFNAHPYVMCAMNGALRHLETAGMKAAYAGADSVWGERAAALNTAFEARALPVRVGAWGPVWTTLYTQPGRYHWMYQFYLRAAGITPAWIGTGRFIFPLALGEAEFDDIRARFVSAAEEMAADGWWSSPPDLDGRAIRRHLLRRMLRARFGLEPSRRSVDDGDGPQV